MNETKLLVLRLLVETQMRCQYFPIFSGELGYHASPTTSLAQRGDTDTFEPVGLKRIEMTHALRYARIVILP